MIGRDVDGIDLACALVCIALALWVAVQAVARW